MIGLLTDILKNRAIGPSVELANAVLPSFYKSH